MNASIALAALLLPVAAASAIAAAPAPRVSVPSVAQLPQPLPLPYDESADGVAAVAKGRALAARTGRRLIVDLGGNWCADCRVLAGVMALPEVRRFLDRHFVVVTVDIGRFDRNGAVAAGYGVTGRLTGVPALLVVDPGTNRLLNRDRLFALADARRMTPQGLADWLAQWA